MDLPDEIRNRIYEFALTPEDGLAIGIGKLDRLGVPTEATEGILTTWSDNYVDRRTFLHGQHSLTQIKGTRDEFFFYATNTFAISIQRSDFWDWDCRPQTGAWFKEIGPENIKHLKKLMVFWHQGGNPANNPQTLEQFLAQEGVTLPDGVDVQFRDGVEH
jgi:hypothetical protein